MNESDVDQFPWWQVGRAIFVGVLAVLLVAGVGDFIYTHYFVQVSSPLQRQRLNHDPAWERAQEAAITDDYTRFVAVRQKLPADRAACVEFVKVHGPARSWGYTEGQEWHELYDVTYQGDYQTEVSSAADLNAHELNTDERPDTWPAGIPTHLTPDPAPAPLVP